MSKHDSWNLTGDKRGNGDQRDASHERLAQEFDAWAEAGRADSMETGHMPTAGQALARIPFDPDEPQRFLDLGCGNGYAVRWAAERMHPDAQATGIDVSPRMLTAALGATTAWEEAREELWERIGEAPPPAAAIVFEEATFDSLPFADASIDIVFSNEALYYAPDLDAALKEAVRVLAPGGTVHLCIDHYQENTISHDWADKTGLGMHMMTRTGWADTLARHGLTDVRTVRLLDPTPVPPMTEEQAAHPDWQRNYRHLIAWKKREGSLLLEARKPT